MQRNLVLALLLAYTFTARGYLEVSDTSLSLQTAESIVTRGALDIAPGPSTLTSNNGRAYSKYGIGLALIYVPVVALAHAISGLSHVPEPALAGFLVSFVNVPFALLLVLTFARLLRRYLPDDAQVTLLAAALGIGTLVWRYAVYDFSEEIQAALLLLAIERATARTTGSVAQVGAAVGALILVKLVHIAFVPAFLSYVFFSSGRAAARRLTSVVTFAAPVLVALAIIGGLNLLRFGRPLESGYGSEAGQFYVHQMRWTVPALIVSLDKGMLVFSPVLLLGVLGWPAFIRRNRGDAALCGSILIVNLALAAAWHSWIGGWSWGPRLLVPAVAVWLLPAASWLAHNISARRLPLAALTCVSIVMQLPGVLTRDQEVHHIRYNMLYEDERLHMLNEPASAWVILAHKLQGRQEVYSTRDFGIYGDRPLDLTRFTTFHGFAIWPAQLAYRLGRPEIAWLAPIGLLAAAGLLARVAAKMRPSFIADQSDRSLTAAV